MEYRKIGNSIGIDSHLLTYLLDVITPEYDIDTDRSGLIPVRQAILRIYFYTGKPFYILPTVQVEYLRITDPARRDAHERVHGIMLLDIPIAPDPESVRVLRDYYLKFHRNCGYDCQILAEAETAQLEIFLTQDNAFYNNLHAKTKSIKLMKPVDLWNSFNISNGVQPIIIPDSTNSLYGKGWWRW